MGQQASTWTGPALRRRVAAGLAAAALTAGAVGGAAGGAPAQAAPTGQLAARLKLACDRVPNAITRTENLQTRLAADASTRGSLAWLQGKADQAKSRNHDQRANDLANRLTVRKDLAALLPGRLVLLQQAQKVCAAHGFGTSS